jgi:hypothetical protein
MKELTGEKFNSLRVLECVGKRHKYNVYRCLCDCGKETVVRSSYLRSGHTKSCGCLSSERAAKHLHSRRGKVSSTYITWRSMQARCLNPNHKTYKDYGARGITITPRWLGLNGFQNFIADMGERPLGMWIERNDNNGHYTPDNCSWATPKQQRANQGHSFVLPMAA